MDRGKRLGIMGLVSLMLLSILPPPAWAQSPPPMVEPTGAQQVAAGMADILYIPAKAGFCIISGVSWLAVLLLSGATAYDTATDVVRAGCGGKWVLEGEDIHFYDSPPPVKAR